MKIKVNDSTFLFPIKNQLNVLVENESSVTFLKCLDEYFGKKKKKYCDITDEFGESIHTDEIEFIYYPFLADYSSNYSFGTKSYLNSELTEYVINNPDMFLSIEAIREDLKGLATDKGINLISKELSRGLDFRVRVQFDELDVSNVLNMMRVENDLSEIEKCLILYNLSIFENRNEMKIIYLDMPITEQVVKWVKEVKSNDTVMIFNSSKIMIDVSKVWKDCSLISISDKDYMETVNYSIDDLGNLIYIFHPYVRQNIELQTEKNIRLANQFIDQSITFYLMFSSNYSGISL